MVGKTFKGLTDEILRWQTTRLQELATPLPGAPPPWEVGKGGHGRERAEHVVRVRPELVVEIRFNDVQRSPRYPGRVALRFARVVRYREDKSAVDVEPLASLVARAPAAGEGEGNPANKERAAGASKKRQLSLFGD
jgi:DNA ligase-1